MKRTFLPIIVLMMIWLLASQGCNLSLPGQVSQNGNKSGAVLYQDDFSNPINGWDTWKDDSSSASYQDGGLRIVVKAPRSDYWSRPGKRFINTRIAVKASKMNGPDDNDYGILCRYNDRNNFYALLISSDGYSGIIKVKDGKYQIISGTSLDYQDVLKKGNDTNYIGADCMGSKLILYANGKLLSQAQDSDISNGEVGLIVGAYDKAGVDVLFDDFTVTQP